MIYLPIPFFVVSMIGDVKAREKNNLKLVKLFQPLTTVFALVVAALSLFKDAQVDYTLYIIAGLILSIFADRLLVSRTDKTAFIRGMILFLGTILIYAYGWTLLSGFQPADRYISSAMLCVYVVLSVLFIHGRHGVDGKPSKKVTIGVLIYLLAFAFAIARAISTFFGDYFTLLQSILLTAGIVLFFIGDLQLGIYHFIDKRFPMGQAPPFYFIGQLLIAYSCSFF